MCDGKGDGHAAMQECGGTQNALGLRVRRVENKKFKPLSVGVGGKKTPGKNSQTTATLSSLTCFNA